MTPEVLAMLQKIVAEASPRDGSMVQALRKEAARLLEAGGLEK